MLIESLLRRYFLLSQIYMNVKPDIPFHEMLGDAGKVKILNNQLRPDILPMYRQGRLTEIPVLHGQISYEGDIDPFWDYLALGSLIHVGKSTTAGLGMYEILTGGE